MNRILFRFLPLAKASLSIRELFTLRLVIIFPIVFGHLTDHAAQSNSYEEGDNNWMSHQFCQVFGSRLAIGKAILDNRNHCLQSVLDSSTQGLGWLPTQSLAWLSSIAL